MPFFFVALFAVFAPAAALAQATNPLAVDIPRWFVETFLDFREDVKEASRDGKRLLVYWGQDGCPYCKLLMQTSFAETKIVDKVRRNFVPIALNIWGDREVVWIDGRKMSEKELARVLGVQFTPTLLFFDEKARVLVRLNGYQPPHRLDATLDFVAQRLENQTSYAKYMDRVAREPASARLNDEPFFLKPAQALRRDGRDVRGSSPRSRPLLVLFERTHCASCDELHREGLRRPEVAALLPKFDVIQLDTADRSEILTPAGRRSSAAGWAQDLGIAYAPALVFFDGNGKEIFRLEAYVRPFHLAGALDYVASGAYSKEPSFQRYLQARAEEMRRRGEKVDLWR